MPVTVDKVNHCRPEDMSFNLIKSGKKGDSGSGRGCTGLCFLVQRCDQITEILGWGGVRHGLATLCHWLNPTKS